MAAEMSPPARPSNMPSARFKVPLCVASDTRARSACPASWMTSPAVTAVSRKAAGSSQA